MSLPKIRYSRLRYYHFIDSQDQDMGSLEDIVLNNDTYEPKYFLLGGGFFEEYLESRGDIEDIDELAPVNLVRGIEDDYVVFKMKFENLTTTTIDGKLPNGMVKFSQLCHLPIDSPENEVSMELFDLILDGSNSRFVFNYIHLSEVLMSEGYQQRFEIAFPIDMIKVENNRIQVPCTTNEILNYIRSNIEHQMRGKSLVNWPRN